MATPIQIAADLIRGKAYFSQLNSENIENLFKGCGCGDSELSVCLARIVKALQYRVDQSIYDEITDGLYTKMMLIIGDFVAPVQKKFYYTMKATSTPLTESQILALPFILAASGSNPVIPFDPLSPPQYGFMAELSTEPLKTKWQDTLEPLNKGDIGTSDDLFGLPLIVNTLRAYQTEYPTNFSNPIQFKVN